MQIKTRYHYTPITLEWLQLKVIIIKKEEEEEEKNEEEEEENERKGKKKKPHQKMASVGKDMATLEPFCPVGGM